jgi:putative acetyltransferase
MISIAISSHVDYSAIAEVNAAAFGEQAAEINQLIPNLRASSAFNDGIELIARIGDRIVGHTMVTRSRLDTFTKTIFVGQLAPLAVHPDFQKQGVARELIEAAYEYTKKAELPLLFVEGDPAFYSRVGFVPAKPLGFRKPSIRIPDAAFQVRLLSGYEDWMTGTLVYAEIFWETDSVGLRDPEFLEWLRTEVAAGREL